MVHYKYARYEKNQGSFLQDSGGKRAVRDWLKELPQEERKTVGEDIKAVEIAWPVGVPLVKKLDTDLWEVRTILPNKISRVFFTVWKGFMILLHGIIKKSQKTPKEDLDLAKKRRNEVFRGGIDDEK